MVPVGHGNAAETRAERPDVLQWEILLLEELDDFLPHLETRRTDGGADGHPHILRTAAEGLLHHEQHLLRDALHRTLPAGMDGGDDAMLRIVHQERHAVRRMHADGAARQGRHQRVIALQLLAARVRALHHGHTETVDLMAQNDGIWKDRVPAGGEGLDARTEIILQKRAVSRHSENKDTLFSGKISVYSDTRSTEIPVARLFACR